MTEEEKKKLLITPYYEREGLAAAGAADEWLAATQKSIDEEMKKLDPATRGLLAERLNVFVNGNYGNLKRFEAREVRLGKLKLLEDNLDRQSAATSFNIAAQADAERRAHERNLEDIEKAFKEATGNLKDDDEGKKKRAEEEQRRAAKIAALEESHNVNMGNHFAQMLTEIDLNEAHVDTAVADGLIDEIDATLRKRKAGRATIQNTITGLIEQGHFDMAEKFLSQLREVVKKDGKEGVASTPLAVHFGFTYNDVAKLETSVKNARKADKHVRNVEELEAKQEKREAFVREERSIHSGAVPEKEEEQLAYIETQAVKYKELSDDAERLGLHDEALRYMKTAEALGFNTVDRKARIAANVERAAIEANKQIFDFTEAEFMVGATVNEQGDVIEMSAADMSERAQILLHKKIITPVQFSKLMAIQATKLEGDAAEFRNGVLANFKTLLPNAIRWRKQARQFEFVPSNSGSKRLRETTQVSAIKIGRDEEIADYKTLVRMMNLTIKWGQQKNASAEEMQTHFENLTQGIVAGIRRRNIKDVMEEEQNIINDWEFTHGN